MHIAEIEVDRVGLFVQGKILKESVVVVTEVSCGNNILYCNFILYSNIKL